MRIKRYLNSSIGKKQFLGVTGLMLCGFLVTHLLGNFLILKGAEAFNTYAHTLITNPLIIPMEIGLLLVFLSHIVLAMKLTIENKMARPQNYYLKSRTGRGATLASSTMPITGMIVLVFLIFHMLHFRFGPHYTVMHHGVEMRDLYRLLLEVFQNPLIVFFYIFATMSLGLHVSHGFWSAFQSIGFNHPEYTPMLKKLALVYAIVIVIGYSILPIYAYLQGGPQ